jgi:predicted kinase
MTKTLVVMRGLPGSGKTTMAKQLITDYEAFGESAIRVNNDEITQDLFGVPYKPGEFRVVQEERFYQVSKGFETHDIVILDNTNLSRNAIDEAKTLARISKASIIVCSLLDVPYTTCLERNNSRERVVPLDTMKYMRNHVWNSEMKQIRLEK